MTAQASRSDAVANRERLIEAAREVFAERGFAAEMKEIAERAGVGIGTIYRNFATKEELAEALCMQLIDEVPALAEEALAQQEPMAGIHVILGHLWDGFERYGWLFYILATRSGDALARVEQQSEPLRALTPVFQRALDAGCLSADTDALTMVICLRSLFYPYRALRAEVGAERAREQLEAFFLRGLGVDRAGGRGEAALR